MHGGHNFEKKSQRKKSTVNWLEILKNVVERDHFAVIILILSLAWIRTASLCVYIR
jgi:hypothetical protein